MSGLVVCGGRLSGKILGFDTAAWERRLSATAPGRVRKSILEIVMERKDGDGGVCDHEQKMKGSEVGKGRCGGNGGFKKEIKQKCRAGERADEMGIGMGQMACLDRASPVQSSQVIR